MRIWAERQVLSYADIVLPGAQINDLRMHGKVLYLTDLAWVRRWSTT